MRASAGVSAASRSAAIIPAGGAAAVSAAIVAATGVAATVISAAPVVAAGSARRWPAGVAASWRASWIAAVPARIILLRRPAGIRSAARTLARVAAVVGSVRPAVVVRIVATARRYDRLLHAQRRPVRTIAAVVSARIVGITAIRIALVRTTLILILPRRFRRLRIIRWPAAAVLIFKTSSAVAVGLPLLAGRRRERAPAGAR